MMGKRNVLRFLILASVVLLAKGLYQIRFERFGAPTSGEANYITLCEVSMTTVGSVSLGYSGFCRQSNDFSTYTCDKTVDGNTNGDITQGFCSQSNDITGDPIFTTHLCEIEYTEPDARDPVDVLTVTLRDDAVRTPDMNGVQVFISRPFQGASPPPEGGFKSIVTISGATQATRVQTYRFYHFQIKWKANNGAATTNRIRFCEFRAFDISNNPITILMSSSAGEEDKFWSDANGPQKAFDGLWPTGSYDSTQCVETVTLAEPAWTGYYFTGTQPNRMVIENAEFVDFVGSTIHTFNKQAASIMQNRGAFASYELLGAELRLDSGAALDLCQVQIMDVNGFDQGLYFASGATNVASNPEDVITSSVATCFDSGTQSSPFWAARYFVENGPVKIQPTKVVARASGNSNDFGRFVLSLDSSSIGQLKDIATNAYVSGGDVVYEYEQRELRIELGSITVCAVRVYDSSDFLISNNLFYENSDGHFVNDHTGSVAACSQSADVWVAKYDGVGARFEIDTQGAFTDAQVYLNNATSPSYTFSSAGGAATENIKLASIELLLTTANPISAIIVCGVEILDFGLQPYELIDAEYISGTTGVFTTSARAALTNTRDGIYDNRGCSVIDGSVASNTRMIVYYAAVAFSSPLPGPGTINIYRRQDLCCLTETNGLDIVFDGDVLARVSTDTSPIFSITLTASPTVAPTLSPSVTPSMSPSTSPSLSPSLSPSMTPTLSPSNSPSTTPTLSPSASPSVSPSAAPSTSPTPNPTDSPSASPTPMPTQSPAPPTNFPTLSPTMTPTRAPTGLPTTAPIGGEPNDLILYAAGGGGAAFVVFLAALLIIRNFRLKRRRLEAKSMMTTGNDA